ncbi:MAG TPA: sugar ABC transporter substrate-binding protein [Gaiellaceae bacterium]
MRRLICAVTVALLALGAVVGAAFAKQEHPGSSKTVTVSYFTFSAAPDHLNTLKALIQIFEKKHPNIQISFQTAPYSDYFTKLQTQIAGGQAPDTFELDYGSFYGYAASGSLLNLSKVAKNDASFNPGIYYPKAYSAFALGKTQYGLPESYSDVLLFYNKDLFRAAGVAFPTAKWTWKDEMAAAKKLTNASKGVWGDYQPIQFYEFYKVLAQNGGSFFNANKTKATFDSPAGIAAANWLLSKPGNVMPTQEQQAGLGDDAMFKLGKLAMWHNGIWQFAAMKDAPFQWDVVVEPAGKVKANHFFANTIAASAKTAHPKEAWEWLKFLSGSHDSVKARIGSSWELAPVKDKAAYAAYLNQRPPTNRQAVLDALNNPVLTPTIKAESQMQDIVGKALQKAELGQTPVAQALHDAATQVNALLK